MARIILVTGGVRSGKSSFAEKLLMYDQNVIYIATCPRIEGDTEIDKRVARHQKRREKFGWKTVEEELDIASLIKGSSSYIVECLTLWINNMMYEAQQRGGEMTEDDVKLRCKSLLKAVDNFSGKVVFVTNETGMGIMPANKTSRLFGDLAGRCNQIMAEAADEVYVMVSGIPVKIKGKE